MTTRRDILLRAIKTALEYASVARWVIPQDLLAEIRGAAEAKTYDYFLRTLSRNVRDLYNGKMTESDFVDSLAEVIDQQMRRAWNEGMRANNLDPQNDMTPEWEQAYQDIVANEYQYVDRFAADIVQGAQDETGTEQFMARAELWANRYTDVVNQAQLITAQKEDRYEWIMGATEQHCATCAALAGTVATAQQWTDSGWRPQSHDLECGGWRCDCRLEITDKPLTDGGITV